MRRHRNEVATTDLRQRLLSARETSIPWSGRPRRAFAPETHNVHRHAVRRAARTFLNLFTLTTGTGVSGEIRQVAIPIAIQHYITHNHDACTFKRWQIYHSCLLRDSKFARDNSIIQTATSHFRRLPAIFSARLCWEIRSRHYDREALQRQ